MRILLNVEISNVLKIGREEGVILFKWNGRCGGVFEMKGGGGGGGGGGVSEMKGGGEGWGGDVLKLGMAC